MLSSTGTSVRGGRASRSSTIAIANSATVAIAERSAIIQSGDRDSRITLFTGHVRPQAMTTMMRKRMPSRCAARSAGWDAPRAGNALPATTPTHARAMSVPRRLMLGTISQSWVSGYSVPGEKATVVSRDVQAGRTAVSSIARGEQFPIRFLPRRLAETPDAAQAVLRMARSIVAASSAHPGLTRVLEFGEVDNGRPFAIMELVEGRRLSEMPLDVAAGMRVALDLGGAVETLHNMGFIHSALCPHNIMVLEDGRIKLLDLELVGLRDAREIRGVIAAEPPAEYLSPEQILKAPVTDKADIYAFGVILYELLCGVRPFEAATREAVLAKQLKEAPVPIHRRRSNVPGSVQRAVTLALP